MFTSFFRRHLYVQLSPHLLTIRDAVSHQVLSEVPEIAIRKPPGKPATVVAVGRAARAAAGEPHVVVHNPFAHPRSLVSDFTVAETLLKALMKQVPGNRFLASAQIVVMHPLGEHVGGLTQVELRALRELALGAGAAKVHLWQGPLLTDEQVVQQAFPATGTLSQ